MRAASAIFENLLIETRTRNKGEAHIVYISEDYIVLGTNEPMGQAFATFDA